ncbi:ankyrin repeat domain-containing protein, partial [bacterium]|nr:ankyrin repeat domain-containing protein [bacterium]
RRELSNGANVNQKNKDGFTLLHLAVKSGHERIVKLLISKGAVVNAKDTRGFTSLDYSTELNEMFFEDEKTAGITITQTMGVRNEDGSVNQVTMNNAKIKKNRVILDLLRKHGGKTGEELKAGLK